MTASVCNCCGMPVGAATYHPYAACLMFKACGDIAMVQANLDAVVAYGIQSCIEKREPVISRLREALSFYAEKKNWQSPSNGFALQYDPEPSPIKKDGGSVALESLENFLSVPK